MGKNVLSDIFKAVAVKPFLDQVKKEKRIEDRRYDKWLNDIDRQADASEKFAHTRVLDVHQPYDSIIHENDFWWKNKKGIAQLRTIP